MCISLQWCSQVQLTNPAPLNYCNEDMLWNCPRYVSLFHSVSEAACSNPNGNSHYHSASRGVKVQICIWGIYIFFLSAVLCAFKPTTHLTLIVITVNHLTSIHVIVHPHVLNLTAIHSYTGLGLQLSRTEPLLIAQSSHANNFLSAS